MMYASVPGARLILQAACVQQFRGCVRRVLRPLFVLSTTLETACVPAPSRVGFVH